VKLGIGIAAVAGLFLAIGLVVHQGFSDVTNAMLSIGWSGLLVITLYHFIPIIFSSVGWKVLLPEEERPATSTFILARWVREAANDLLPVAQIGGQIIGARVLTHKNTRAGTAGASVVVDMTVEVLSQFLFTLIGVGLLIISGTHNDIVENVIIGVLIALPLFMGFVMAQHWGMFKLLEQAMEKMANKWNWHSLGRIESLHDNIITMYQNRYAILSSTLLHLIAWTASSGGVWLPLYFMGFPISLMDALLIESLGQAIRSAAFIVPGALGVQEGGYMLLGTVVGLGPEVGLAVSLIKRVRDLILGLPAILLWQIMEGKSVFFGTVNHKNRIEENNALSGTINQKQMMEEKNIMSSNSNHKQEKEGDDNGW